MHPRSNEPNTPFQIVIPPLLDVANLRKPKQEHSVPQTAIDSVITPARVYIVKAVSWFSVEFSDER